MAKLKKLKQQEREEKEKGPDFQKYALYTIVAVLFFGLIYGLYSFVVQPPSSSGGIPLGSPGSTHEHPTITVLVKGVLEDFSQAKYQLRSDYVHFEQSGGSTVHVHATGVTLGFLFQSLGLSISKDCITVETGEFCNGKQGSLSVRINGFEIQDPSSYLIKEGDLIQIRFE